MDANRLFYEKVCLSLASHSMKSNLYLDMLGQDVKVYL